MSSNSAASSFSRIFTPLGWVFSILPSLLLLFSGTMKFIKPAGMEEGMQRLGWQMSQATGLGILEIVCTIIYLVPQTAVLGAILLTAFMGGAVATHVRVGDPYITQVVVGILIWAGLWLRDPKLRDFIPLNR